MIRAEIYNKRYELIDMIYDFKEIKIGRKFRGAGELLLSIQALNFVESLEIGNIVVVNDDAYWIQSQQKYKNLLDVVQFEVRGRHINSILRQRVLLKPFTFTPDKTYEEQIIQMLQENIINPSNTERQISNFEVKRNNINVRPTTYYKMENMTLQEAINNVCGNAELGYKINFNPKSKDFVFEILQGRDKTREVFFSEEFNNVANSELKRDISDSINVCYLNNSGTIQQFGAGKGIDRVEDIIEGTESKEANEQLQNRKMKETVTTDILKNEQFEYKKDWDLGDVVKFIDKDIGFSVEKPVLEVTEIYGKKFDLEVTFGERKPLFTI